jgi:hypothetical protein
VDFLAATTAAAAAAAAAAAIMKTRVITKIKAYQMYKNHHIRQVLLHIDGLSIRIEL